MKIKNAFLLMIFLCGFSFTHIMAQKQVKITFKYVFTKVNEGYDHISRMKVYVDNTLVGTSTEKKESKTNTFTISMKPGFHTLRAVMETKYEGGWEEHIIDNEYSIDCVYEKAMDFKKKMNIQLEFNIELGETIMVKEK